MCLQLKQQQVTHGDAPANAELSAPPAAPLTASPRRCASLEGSSTVTQEIGAIPQFVPAPPPREGTLSGRPQVFDTALHAGDMPVDHHDGALPCPSTSPTGRAHAGHARDAMRAMLCSFKLCRKLGIHLDSEGRPVTVYAVVVPQPLHHLARIAAAAQATRGLAAPCVQASFVCLLTQFKTVDLTSS